MTQSATHTTAQLPINDFFGWKRHPFADTYVQRRLWMPPRDRKHMEIIKRLLDTGKSTALWGPSGSGKTTLIHGLLGELDKNVSFRQACLNTKKV